MFLFGWICIALLAVDKLDGLRLERRRLVWINVTAHPTAEWIARQITEAFPWVRRRRGNGGIKPGKAGPELRPSQRAGRIHERVNATGIA
jgi:hypothetical protein